MEVVVVVVVVLTVLCGCVECYNVDTVTAVVHPVSYTHLTLPTIVGV